VSRFHCTKSAAIEFARTVSDSCAGSPAGRRRLFQHQPVTERPSERAFRLEAPDRRESSFHSASAVGHSPTIPRTSMGSASMSLENPFGQIRAPGSLHEQIAAAGQQNTAATLPLSSIAGNCRNSDAAQTRSQEPPGGTEIATCPRDFREGADSF